MEFLQRLHKSVIWSMFVGRSFIDKVIDALIDTINSNRDDDNVDDTVDDGNDLYIIGRFCVSVCL